MREILFRGQRFDGVWVEGYFFAKPILEKYFIIIGEDQYMVKPETVGQYTGLTDKNGVKIFEGDIIKDDWGKIYTVIFTTKSCSFMVECTVALNEYEKGRYWIGDAWCESISVIGNIHDNPELLKEGGE